MSDIDARIDKHYGFVHLGREATYGACRPEQSRRATAGKLQNYVRNLRGKRVSVALGVAIKK